MTNIAYLVTDENITISRNGKTHIIGRQYSQFQSIIDALVAEDYDKAFELADTAMAIAKQSAGALEVKDGVVYRNGLPVHNVVTERIIKFKEQGLPFKPLVRFLDNLMQNPSARSVNELYKFLENKFLPITKDGCFLAYKAVQNDYLSITSGTTEVRVSEDGGNTWKTIIGRVPNDIGNIVEVDRNQVDDNAENTCSYGLHVGALEYASTFGGYDTKKVVVKVNPRDAVSVPADYNAQKLRASRYEVISDLEEAITEPLVSVSSNTAKTSGSVGYKPSGVAYHNERDEKGRFCKIQAITATEQDDR